METPFQLPKPAPKQAWRTPDSGIPHTVEQRLFLKNAAVTFVEQNQLVPPMPFDELRQHAEALLEQHRIESVYRDFVAVLINNAAWEDILATIPYDRRLLLMPKCMRKEAVCPAPFDEFGLLCKQCGQCSLQDLQLEAERLGYAVLIAEGSALVTAIIETGKIEAIVGVSCLSVLEKAFPFMEAAAIPGIAIPLLQGDCLDTNVDLDQVWDVVHLTSDDQTRRLDLEALREEVATWFSPAALETIMGPTLDPTEQIARAWLGKDGKRWRPFLAACAWKALQENPDTPFPDDFAKIAVAVECFHKASLIHDDIEDEDLTRYGEPTLHAERGLAVALNAGDLLIGEGYRLIAEAESAAAPAIAQMIRIAAASQRALCQGQGAELSWARDPQPLSPTEVLEIFAKKTAPAFEVALRLGAAFAGANAHVHQRLTEFSQAMGIAYQIRDDLDDANNLVDPDDLAANRPTLLLALAHQKALGDEKRLLEQLWRRNWPENQTQEETLRKVRHSFERYEVTERAENLLESYKEQAVFALKDLENATLKGMLRRVLGKIFNKPDMKEWCQSYSERHPEEQPTLVV